MMILLVQAKIIWNVLHPYHARFLAAAAFPHLFARELDRSGDGHIGLEQATFWTHNMCGESPRIISGSCSPACAGTERAEHTLRHTDLLSIDGVERFRESLYRWYSIQCPTAYIENNKIINVVSRQMLVYFLVQDPENVIV